MIRIDHKFSTHVIIVFKMKQCCVSYFMIILNLVSNKIAPVNLVPAAAVTQVV